MAEPALAGAHRHGRVSLCELDRVESLRQRPLQVLDGDVLADADEAPVAVARARGAEWAEVAGDPADGLDAPRQLARDEDAALRVVGDSRTGLREEGVGRLRSAGSE